MSTLTKVALSFIGELKPDRAKGRASEKMTLPPPKKVGGIPLMEAFAKRSSAREFSPRPLPEQLLSDLLWAAFGVNRPANGHRTAPSAMNAQEIDVYVALSGGLYVYQAKTHSLSLVTRVDARRVTGYQDFVDEAPLDLVYVADQAHMKMVSQTDRDIYSAACAGAIAQNVYLYCASVGLITVLRGWLDRAAIAKALGLSEHEHVLLAQTVGYAQG
jgi:SagB-type dehydrogenase family enzyme